MVISVVFFLAQIVFSHKNTRRLWIKFSESLRGADSGDKCAESTVSWQQLTLAHKPVFFTQDFLSDQLQFAASTRDVQAPFFVVGHICQDLRKLDGNNRLYKPVWPKTPEYCQSQLLMFYFMLLFSSQTKEHWKSSPSPSNLWYAPQEILFWLTE